MMLGVTDFSLSSSLHVWIFYTWRTTPQSLSILDKRGCIADFGDLIIGRIWRPTSAQPCGNARRALRTGSAF